MIAWTAGYLPEITIYGNLLLMIRIRFKGENKDGRTDKNYAG